MCGGIRIGIQAKKNQSYEDTIFKMGQVYDLETPKGKVSAEYAGSARSETLSQKWGHIIKANIQIKADSFIERDTRMRKDKSLVAIATNGKLIDSILVPSLHGNNRDRFLIVTKEAEGQAALIHNRMPRLI